jgi:hypothetical protein
VRQVVAAGMNRTEKTFFPFLLAGCSSSSSGGGGYYNNFL